MLPLSEHCRPLASPNIFTVTLASVLVVGILVSYIPQHLKIIQRRTSEGLSPWWVLLGGLSSIAALGNILVLPASRDDIKCCRELNGGACAAALLGVTQIGCQWACFTFIVLLFLIFFPTEPPIDVSVSVGSLTSDAPSPKRRDQIIVGSVTLIALLVVGITSLALVNTWPNRLQTWADILGTIAGVLAAIQYLPQIWYTFRLRDVMSLSIVTMLIQVPGAFVFALSLWLRVGWEGWSTWLTYIVTGVLQGILLMLAIRYWMADQKPKNLGDDAYPSSLDDMDGADDADDEEDEAPSESSTLIGQNGNGSKRKASARQDIKRNGTQRSTASNRQLNMLYAATPPEHDSDLEGRGRASSRR